MKERLEKVIDKMLDRFSEDAQQRSMEYSYGFFDAVAVVREMINTETVILSAGE